MNILEIGIEQGMKFPLQEDAAEEYVGKYWQQSKVTNHQQGWWFVT